MIKNYRKIYEDFYKLSILPGNHIHHIDGNPDNNDITNLLLVTPEEHYNIHLQQGDTIALHGNFIQFAAQYGEKNPMFGKQHMEDSIRKNSESNKKYIQTDEQRRKNSESHMGPKNNFWGQGHTMIGEKNHFFGKQHTIESIRKNSESNKLTAQRKKAAKQQEE